MNVQFYIGKFDEATWQLFAYLGITTPAETELLGLHIDSALKKSCKFPKGVFNKVISLITKPLA